MSYFPDITALALKKSRLTVVILIILAASGVYAFLSLPRAEDPGFTIRVAAITTIFPGAGPERVEDLVTKKIERAVMKMPELDYVRSESRSSVSLIFVHIKDTYTDMRPIWDDLKDEVDKVRPELPDEVVGPNINDDFGDVFGILLAIRGKGRSYAELRDIADEVRDEALLLSQSGRVEIFGAQEERVFVEYEQARLSELGYEPLDLMDLLEATNILTPGGQVTAGKERITIEPTGEFQSLQDIRETVVPLPEGEGVVRLKDVAHVEHGYIDPPRHRIRTMGDPCLIVGVSLRKDGNIMELGEQFSRLLERLRDEYPAGIEFSIVSYQPDRVREITDTFVNNLLQAMAVVILIMLVFLGIRTGLVTAVLIPMTMLMSFLLMYFFDIGLDQVSLSSLIIALGMLVDNAIVVSESILVMGREGKGLWQAAVDSAAELRGPLLASSLTTASAFLPIFLADSLVGEYTSPLFKVVTIALLSSWFLAITMTPFLCRHFLKVDNAKTENCYDNRFYEYYRGFLTTILKRPVITLGTAAVLFGLAIAGSLLVPNIFFPPSDRETFTLELTLPEGVAYETTSDAVHEIEEHVDNSYMASGDTEGVTDYTSFIGKGTPRFILPRNPDPQASNFSVMIFNTTSRPVVDEIIPELDRWITDRHPDAVVKIEPLELGPPVDVPIAVRVSGPDTDRVFEITGRIKEKLRSIPGVKERSINDNWGNRIKKIKVEVDQARATMNALTSHEIAISLLTGLSGLEVSEYNEEDQTIPIVLRSKIGEDTDVTALETMNVYSTTKGWAVPLSQVADIEVGWEPSRIMRRDQMRTVEVRAQLDPGVTAAEVNDELTGWLKQQSADWGLGYDWALGGTSEESAKANRSILVNVPFAAFIIVLLLVGEFDSIRKALLVLMTIPLGAIGVIIGLIIGDSYIGFMTILGFISLSGIVVNNAIVLIDRIGIEMDNYGPRRAIIEASQRRFRPIMLTTGTTVMGMLPLWLGGGPMWEPLAITIIFGLIFATLLTLGVIPVLYSVLYRIRFKGYEYEC